MLFAWANTESDSSKTTFSYILAGLKGEKDERGTIEVIHEKIDELPRITEEEYANLVGEDSQDISILEPDGVETTFVLYHDPLEATSHCEIFVLRKRQTKLVSKKKEIAPSESRFLPWWMIITPLSIVVLVMFGMFSIIGLIGKESTFWAMNAVLIAIFAFYILAYWKTK